MKPNQKPISRSGAGFTLVELLVVITIIVVLAALSLAGIRAVRQNAQSVRCTENLRSWGLAIRGYASENNGAVVWNGWASIATTNRYYETYLGGSLDNATSTMDGKRVFATQLFRRCPSQAWDGSGNGPVGYAMTRPNPKTANVPSYNINTASDPTQLLMMIDGSALNISGSGDFATAVKPICLDKDPRHRHNVNALFADGHIATYKWSDLNGKTPMLDRWLTLK